MRENKERIDIDLAVQGLRLLARFWLDEVRREDGPELSRLPGLGDTLPESLDEEALTLLAVEYQRLFGFNLPPYESVFIDPSAMLDAPAARLVQRSYAQIGFRPPLTARAAAADHLGFELLALAESRGSGPILTGHLALWLPVFIFSLRRLQPHPFYAALGELTLSLVLELLPEDVAWEGEDLFPHLPPPPVYRDTEEPPGTGLGEDMEPAGAEEAGPELGLNRLTRRLLAPRQAGLYLSKSDLARLGQELDLPVSLSERFAGLRGLFQLAGQYELVPQLQEALGRLYHQEAQMRAGLAQAYPAWAGYARAWGRIGEPFLPV